MQFTSLVRGRTSRSTGHLARAHTPQATEPLNSTLKIGSKLDLELARGEPRRRRHGVGWRGRREADCIVYLKPPTNAPAD